MKQIPIPNVELFSEVRRLMAAGREVTILARGSSMLPFIRDGVDMSRAEFYDRLEAAEKLPRTSQPSPESFIQAFEEARDAGDEVVAILISSKLSGTFQCAQLAAEECEFHDVYFVDSDTASPGEYILIREAVRLREEGISAAEIAAQRAYDEVVVFQ